MMESIFLKPKAIAIVSIATLVGTGIAILDFFPPDPSICTYAFRIFDSNTQKPISHAQISMSYGVKLDVKHTDSEGYYQFNIPCDKDKVLTKVEIEADGYEAYHRHFNALSEREEIYLNPLEKRLDILPKASPSSTKTITAVGIASPQQHILDPTQRRASTKRAATIIARRNLREQIEVSIQARSKVEFGSLSEDEIEILVKGTLKQSHTISEKEKPDGSFEVIMEAPLIQ